MHKFLIYMGLLVFARADFDHGRGPNGEVRLCPDDYKYAGDDTPKTKDVFLEEAYRSPVYSCYRVFNIEAKEFFDASFKCQKDKGHLVSFEDMEEMERFKKVFDNEFDLVTNELYLTSGLFIENNWVWSGTNNTYHTGLLGDVEGSMNKSCLAVWNHMELIDPTITNGTLTYKNVACFDASRYICELRVETVTYYAWFVANWFSVLMVFLVFVLMISLCVSATMVRRRPTYSRQVYRQSSHVFDDQPPSYNRATGNTRVNRYMNRGREFLARANPSQNEKAQMANEA